MHMHFKLFNYEYVDGNICIVFQLLVSGLLAFRVYNKGPSITVSEEAEAEVKCAVSKLFHNRDFQIN